jgi:hypothetical protein
LWYIYLKFQTLFQIDIETEYDLIQLVGEGWFSRVYLAGKPCCQAAVELLLSCYQAAECIVLVLL